jgi:hypothetical protein
MRIAVVCATYVQGKSYQENIWAEQLAKAGHAVRVFAAGDATEAVKRIEHLGNAYEVQTVQANRRMRGTFRSRALPGAVAEFRPDLIVICGDKTFVVPLCRELSLATVPIISTFSENLAMHEFDWCKRGISLKQRLWAIGFILVRGGPIRVVCRRSALLIGNTPQAREILSRVFRKSEWTQINGRLIDVPLGFSPDHFSFDPQVRQRVRAELGVTDRETLVCVTSHFIPVKEPSVKTIISSLAALMPKHPTLRALIVGFSEKPGQAEVSTRIGRHIEQTVSVQLGDAATGNARFIRHPFADRTRLFELYNASDIAVFNRASISCQESLGTGLIGCFSDDGSLNHLVTMPHQGMFFQPGNEGDLAEKLSPAVRRLSEMDAAERSAFRRQLADGSRWLGYDRIIAEIFDELAKRNRGG